MFTRIAIVWSRVRDEQVRLAGRRPDPARVRRRAPLDAHHGAGGAMTARGTSAPLRAFGANEHGNTLASFGIAFPLLAAVVGVGLDYAGAAQARSKMQAVTDAAALYAAREFQMVQANVAKVTAVARNYAQQIQSVAVDVAVDPDALTVRVTLD